MGMYMVCDSSRLLMTMCASASKAEQTALRDEFHISRVRFPGGVPILFL